MKFLHNIYLAFFVFILSGIIFTYAIFNYCLSPTSQDNQEIVVEIKPGSINSIANTLYQKKLIKNKWTFIVYTKITNQTNLKAATYTLSKNMGAKKIIKILSGNQGKNTNQISITFKEGWNIRKIAKTISEHTNHQEEEFFEILKDNTYLEKLINTYWFLTEDILNPNIYYSLEGYLYPNTYYFSSKNVQLEEIIEKMLSETEKQLSNYQQDLQNNQKSIHEIFTLASIVELEGTTLEDRAGISSVFQNRIHSNMNLGSDVTTYYASKIEMGERDLYSSEINSCNFYNTRCSTFTQLPISPICNPSIESIRAVLEERKTDYYYFVADKNKKVYFSKTLNEHNATINKLKKEGLWYEY